MCPKIGEQKLCEKIGTSKIKGEQTPATPKNGTVHILIM